MPICHRGSGDAVSKFGATAPMSTNPSGHEMVPEQQRDRDGGVAFPRKVWPHSCDWQPERQLMLKQNKSPHALLSCKSEFNREGMNQNQIRMEIPKTKTMMATVNIVPHASHGGPTFGAEIRVDRGGALSLVSEDWAKCFGVVEEPDTKPIKRVLDNRALDCTGMVSFTAEYGGNTKVVLAWISLTAREQLWLSYQVQRDLGLDFAVLPSGSVVDPDPDPGDKKRPLGLNNEAYEVVRLANPQEIRSPGVPRQEYDPLDLGPSVKLFKPPSKVGSTTVKSWVVPDFTVDVNSNAITQNKEASKTGFAGTQS